MTGMRVLIVEDEVLVAAEIEFLIEEAGMTPVGIAITSTDALDAIAREKPDLILLDVHLADGPTGVAVARKAVEAGALALFTTANQRRLPDDLAGAIGSIAKPYTEWGMIAALRFVSECVSKGAASKPAPGSLELAPAWKERWSVPAAAAV